MQKEQPEIVPVPKTEPIEPKTPEIFPTPEKVDPEPKVPEKPILPGPEISPVKQKRNHIDV